MLAVLFRTRFCSRVKPALIQRCDLLAAVEAEVSTFAVCWVLKRAHRSAITRLVHFPRQSIAFACLALCLACTHTRAQTTLIASNAVWKYLDTGTNNFPTWTQINFDDSAWASGPAELGYGDGGEATTVNGGAANNHFTTTWFRRSFTVANAALFTNLLLNLVRDDGAVVYLNGVEVWRSNMPDSPVTPFTLAATGVSGANESAFFSTALSARFLSNGPNVIAVEVHQSDPGSSDISFNLELRANVTGLNIPPLIALTNPAPGSVRASGAPVMLAAQAGDDDGAVARVDFFQDGVLVSSRTTPPYALTVSNLADGFHRFIARATDNLGATNDSRPVNIFVCPATNHAVAFADWGDTNRLFLGGATLSHGNLLRLNATNGGTGAAYIGAKQFIRQGFSSTFTFHIHDFINGGADGFTFFIVNNAALRVGPGAGELGYTFISNSLAVEFDTFQNPGFNDPNGNHISIHSLGTATNTALEDIALARNTSIANLSDGNVRTARVDYIPGTMSVYLDNVFVVTAFVNLDTLLDLDHGRAWVGFTSSTGGSKEAHDILNWSFVAPYERPKLTLSLRDPDRAPVIEFLSAADLNYEIQSASTLPSWTTLTNLPGTGGVLQWVDAGAAGTQRFYRVIVGP
jgi:hypothetical protein